MAEGFPSPTTHRPAITGNHYMASTGHYLATAAAFRILEKGGNAIDAGVAAGMCVNILQPDLTSLGGVAPLMIYSAKHDEVRVISGLGNWPAKVTREFFADTLGTIPGGIEHCVLPAAIDSWLTALRLYGTLSLAEVAESAIQLAEEGWAAYEFFCANIKADAHRMKNWSENARIFLKDGKGPEVGDRIVQEDAGHLLRLLVAAEEESRHLGRDAAILAARDRFYKGDIAELIANFFEESGGFITLEDLQSFSVDVEEPLRVTYRGYDVYSCPPWCQGPVALETLSILDGYDVAALGHNSPELIHLIDQALNASFADREKYYGDPKFIDVPIDGLLNSDYAATWRARISSDSAFPGMPDPGDPYPYRRTPQAVTQSAYQSPRAFEAEVDPDTSYLCVVDAQGNAFSATPSDGATNTPIVPGIGIIVSGRGGQSWIDEGHPSAIAPGKRPRLTPSPGLIMKDGRVFAPYGTPGNDVQPQAMVQLAINLIDFGMDPQTAVETPRFASYSYPRSSHPHPYSPGAISIEGRIPDETRQALVRLGHKVEVWPDWSPRAGSLCTIVVGSSLAPLVAGADPRRLAYALGW